MKKKLTKHILQPEMRSSNIERRTSQTGIQVVKQLLPDDSPKRVGEMIPEWITIHEVFLGTELEAPDRDFHYYSKLLEDKTSTVGYHFLVEANDNEIPRIYQFLECHVSSHHTGNQIGNAKSIGIERLVNVNTNFEVAIAMQAKLTATLMEKYKITLAHVVTHKYWSGKECPARMLAGLHGGWEHFINLVKKYYEEKDFIEGIL